MDFYATSGVAKLFQVTDQTVKNWAREFASHLSPTSQPGDGKRRTFTTEDLAVFALVHSYGSKGMNYEDAQAALIAGQRGSIPGGVSELATAAAPPALLERLREEISQRDRMINSLKTDNDKRQGQIELLEKQLQNKEQEIRQLYRDLATLEVKGK